MMTRILDHSINACGIGTYTIRPCPFDRCPRRNFQWALLFTSLGNNIIA
jgi:hypothetical protein